MIIKHHIKFPACSQNRKITKQINIYIYIYLEREFNYTKNQVTSAIYLDYYPGGQTIYFNMEYFEKKMFLFERKEIICKQQNIKIKHQVKQMK